MKKLTKSNFRKWKRQQKLELVGLFCKANRDIQEGFRLGNIG